VKKLGTLNALMGDLKEYASDDEEGHHLSSMHSSLESLEQKIAQKVQKTEVLAERINRMIGDLHGSSNSIQGIKGNGKLELINKDKKSQERMMV